MTAVSGTGETALKELPRVETLTWGHKPAVVAMVRARYPDLTPRELAQFLYEAFRLELDPGALGQIYAVVYSKDNPAKRSLSIQIGIPGFRLIAAKTGLLNGSADVEDGPEATTTYKSSAGREVVVKHPEWCRATIYRKGADHGFTATVRWAERVKLGYDGLPTDFWRDQPYGQLEKCAESLALRKAFPAETRDLTLEGAEEPGPHEGAVDAEVRPVTAAPQATAAQELAAVQAEVRGLIDGSPEWMERRMVSLLTGRLDLLKLAKLGDATTDNLEALKALRDDLAQLARGA